MDLDNLINKLKRGWIQTNNKQICYKKFPYKGSRTRSSPCVKFTKLGKPVITNDLFGGSIFQFEHEFKACLKRRHENYIAIQNIIIPVQKIDQSFKCTGNN